MSNIINNNVLLGEIRRIVQEELENIIPKHQINIIFENLNSLHERIKILEDKS